MMNLTTRISAALILTFGAAAASAGVINFDNLTGGELNAGALVTNQYSGLGVTFNDTYTGGAHAAHILGSFMPGSTSPNVLWVDQGGNSFTGQFLQVNFASAVNGVSALYGISAFFSPNITLEVYGGSTLLNTVTLGGGLLTGELLSGNIGLNDTGITSARFFSRNTAEDRSLNFNIDNLIWGDVRVQDLPEPASLALVTLALTGLVATRRRKA